jgi:hypothetical protein
MALAIGKDSIFFHIPKTGGNSLRKYLEDFSGFDLKEVSHKHATPDYLMGRQSIIGFLDFRRQATFNKRGLVLVRNPYSWYESWYKYQISRGVVKWGESRFVRRWHPMSPLNYLPYGSFEDFVSAAVNLYPSFFTQIFHRYISLPGTSVIKMENLTSNPIDELVNAGLNSDLLRSNKFPKFRPSPHAEIPWSSSLRKKLFESEHLIFEQFNYEFDPKV